MAVKFLCDHMLGTLAKWLRFLGHDVAYPGPLDDPDVIAVVHSEDRHLLTRDRELAGRVAGASYVSSDDLDEQLVQVLRTFHLEAEISLTRCSVCNTALLEISKDEAKGKVPDRVYEQQEEFWRCGGCGRYYWQGTHWNNMAARLLKIQGKLRDVAP